MHFCGNAFFCIENQAVCFAEHIISAAFCKNYNRKFKPFWMMNGHKCNSVFRWTANRFCIDNIITFLDFVNKANKRSQPYAFWWIKLLCEIDKSIYICNALLWISKSTGKSKNAFIFTKVSYKFGNRHCNCSLWKIKYLHQKRFDFFGIGINNSSVKRTLRQITFQFYISEFISSEAI